jgi:hypothetical protein
MGFAHLIRSVLPIAGGIDDSERDAIPGGGGMK